VSYDEEAKKRTTVRWSDEAGRVRIGYTCPDCLEYEAEIAASDRENEALRAEVQRFAVEALVAEGDAMELHAEVQRLLKREKELEGKVTGRDIALAQERAEVQRLKGVIQRAYDGSGDSYVDFILEEAL
jgi:predicted nucleic acid-binding protein